jgi:hypothetical protein
VGSGDDAPGEAYNDAASKFSGGSSAALSHDADAGLGNV